MEEFLYAGSWFEKKYKEMSAGRYHTFKAALNIFFQRPSRIIVETGTVRLQDDFGAGYSTYIFGDFLNHYGMGKLYTVDISSQNISTCREVTSQFSQYIDYSVDDSIHFFSEFKLPIGLLYLDSLDFPLNGDDPTPCQTHQLNEFKLAEKNLNEQSVVLLDDNNFPTGGKTKMTKEYMIKKGWYCVLDEQQSLWIRK